MYLCLCYEHTLSTIKPIMKTSLFITLSLLSISSAAYGADDDKIVNPDSTGFKFTDRKSVV